MDVKRIKKANWNLEALGKALSCHWDGYGDYMIHDLESFVITEGTARGTFNIVEPGSRWKVLFTEKYKNIDYIAISKYGYLIYFKNDSFIGINPVSYPVVVTDNYIKENKMGGTKALTIKRETKIPGTNLILEAGDKVYVKEKTVTVSKSNNTTEELEVYDSVPRGWNLWVGFKKEGLMGIGKPDPVNKYHFSEVGVLSTKFTADELYLLSVKSATGLGFRRPEQYQKLKKLKRNSLPRYQKVLDDAYELMTTKIKWD